MIYDLIDELVNALRQDPVYLAYLDALDVLKRDDIDHLIKNYQKAVADKEDVARYGAYIDLSDYDRKIEDARKQLYALPEVFDYLMALKKVNALTDEVTSIVFANISDELQLGRMGMLFARHSW